MRGDKTLQVWARTVKTSVRRSDLCCHRTARASTPPVTTCICLKWIHASSYLIQGLWIKHRATVGWWSFHKRSKTGKTIRLLHLSASNRCFPRQSYTSTTQMSFKQDVELSCSHWTVLLKWSLAAWIAFLPETLGFLLSNAPPGKWN